MQTQQFIDPYKLVTDTIIDQLEKGAVPWRQPWRRDVGKPKNFQTGKEYRGVNIILLNCRRFASPYWMTFNQVKEKGGSVQKGEHGSLVVKYGTFKKRAEGEDEEKKRGYLKGYRVFNALQITGIEFPQVPGGPAVEIDERVPRAQAIVAGYPSPPTIREGKHVSACYSRGDDTVDMPARARFDTMESFYATLFHELVHSTGHESRLNRSTLVGNDGFRGKVYSEEELVAEMGAAFLGTEADIVRDGHEQSAAYLRSWIETLREKDHRRWVVRAANQAAKAADFILNRMPPSEEALEPATA